MKRYIPLTQQPYCCLPACIQMVLLRRNISLKSQEDIGYELGLRVPKKDKKLFRKVKMGKKPIGGWGTQVQKSIYSINNFFRRNKIPLKEKYLFLYNVQKIKKFLKENLTDKDIIVCFNYKKLYGKGSQGHVSIIENFKGNHLNLIESGYNLPKYREVSLEKLSESIKSHGKKRRAGFWIISSTGLTE